MIPFEINVSMNHKGGQDMHNLAKSLTYQEKLMLIMSLHINTNYDHTVTGTDSIVTLKTSNSYLHFKFIIKQLHRQHKLKIIMHDRFSIIVALFI